MDEHRREDRRRNDESIWMNNALGFENGSRAGLGFLVSSFIAVSSGVARVLFVSVAVSKWCSRLRCAGSAAPRFIPGEEYGSSGAILRCFCF